MNGTYKNLVGAAHAYGRAHQVRGGHGGWLVQTVDGTDVKMGIQGWENYGIELVRHNLIHVLDEAGCRIDREKTPRGVEVQPYSMWRRHARSFVVPELQPAVPTPALGLGLLDVPEAVAIDTQGGYVFRNAEDGLAFTVAGAQAFAAKRNEHLKVPTYKVYRLAEVAFCRYCGAEVHQEDWEGREFFETNWAADVAGTQEDRLRCQNTATYHDVAV